MRIAIGILGTLLAAFSTWIFLLWIRVPGGFGGLGIESPFGSITVVHGKFLIPTPFPNLPYAGIPVWSLIPLGALLALYGFLTFAKRKTNTPPGFPVQSPTPQQPS